MAGIEVGDRAPDFALESTAGETVRLSESFGADPTVIVIFRAHWCSFCSEQLQTFSLLMPDLWRYHDLRIRPISGDPIPKLKEMRDIYDLRFPLLSDPDLEVSRTYAGVEDTDAHGQIPRPGDKGTIPIPATYILDTDGIVRYRHIGERPDDRTYANYVRHFLKSHSFSDAYEDIYPGTFPNPYVED